MLSRQERGAAPTTQKSVSRSQNLAITWRWRERTKVGLGVCPSHRRRYIWLKQQKEVREEMIGFLGGWEGFAGDGPEMPGRGF